MKYFKNTELAKLYNVSEKSVRNWVDATRQGKLDFQLHEQAGKFYIANTSKNSILVETLVEKGKKYKNSRGLQVIRPTEKFYSLYTPKQIFDIISNMGIHREVPLQYCYFDGGAERWDQYTQNLLKEGSSNPLTNTITLLELNLPYLDKLLKNYNKVNIIDIGVGNALPIRSVLEHFVEQRKLNRYIALDISAEMLKIAEHNVASWFGRRVHFEGHIRDFNYDRFDDLLVADSFGTEGASTVNLIFF